MDKIEVFVIVLVFQRFIFFVGGVGGICPHLAVFRVLCSGINLGGTQGITCNVGHMQDKRLILCTISLALCCYYFLKQSLLTPMQHTNDCNIQIEKMKIFMEI